MAGMPTNQRDQILFAIGFIAVIGAGAYWYFVDDPARNDPATGLAVMEAHLDTLNQSNQRAKALMARGTATTIRAEADSLRANLEILRTLVPVSNEVPLLIEQVSDAARRVRLELGAIDPAPPIEGEMFDTFRYQVKVNGSFHEIAQMLTNIASLGRVMAPINLALVPGIPTDGRVVEGRQYLLATFGIQTYVVRTAPQAGPPTP